jgi:hypothetical protein
MTGELTLFPNTATWKSPDGERYNHTDHLLRDNRHKSDLMDIITCGGDNIDSEYYLIAASLSPRISNVKKYRGSGVDKFKYH